MERTWTGNVRELRNTVIRMHSLGVTAGAPENGAGKAQEEKGAAQAAAEEEIDLAEGFFAARERVVERFERRYLAEALRRSGGNVSQAAQMIGVSRKFMHRAIVQYRLRGEAEGGDEQA
jgi:DNA-binding NtrC family response regulator